MHVLISTPTYLSAAKMVQYLKGKIYLHLIREFSELRKIYWGSHLWGRGYFCTTVGAVTEEMIKKYIENQTDEPGTFKVWDERNIGDEGSPCILKITLAPVSLGVKGRKENLSLA